MNINTRRASVYKHVGKYGSFQKIWKFSQFLSQVLRNSGCVVLSSGLQPDRIQSKLLAYYLVLTGKTVFSAFASQ